MSDKIVELVDPLVDSLVSLILVCFFRLVLVRPEKTDPRSFFFPFLLLGWCQQEPGRGLPVDFFHFFPLLLFLFPPSRRPLMAILFRPAR